MMSRRILVGILELSVLGLLVLGGWRFFGTRPGSSPDNRPGRSASQAGGLTSPVGGRAKPFLPGVDYRPFRVQLDSSGYSTINLLITPWKSDASLEEIRERWQDAGRHGIELIDRQLADPKRTRDGEIAVLYLKAAFFNCEGKPEAAYKVLEQLRSIVEGDDKLAQSAMGTVIYQQGVTALRRAENDNCIECRGESSCIFPIATAAVHTNSAGSRLAIRHFTEYLDQFPHDLETRWLLNLAHMTLGEYPDRVDPRFRLNLDRFVHSEFDIGPFRDVSHLVGLERFNVSGGAIMDDFDNDGLLDLVMTSSDPGENMAYFRNKGDSTFEDRTEAAGLVGQLGGLVCYQADYDNDGRLDIFIPRGAWHNWPMRPTLLRNRGDGGFIDVTRQAGLLDPVNSNAAAWADYDNDGWVDLFVGCERQVNRLYRNKGDGTFEELAARAGLGCDPARWCKGCTWLDFDNDGFPDLFLNNLSDVGRLYRNNRDGHFIEVTTPMGIDGPRDGFSCWSWDYDNDGWLDIFATSFDRTVPDVVFGLMGWPHSLHSSKLFRNREGKGFQDMTAEAGLDMVFSTMGSNFGDFDNDGFLDMYLGTGAPNLGFLVPNRMFKNVEGRRFAEISSSSRTGHLQKGHGVACGDWDRDGDVDIFIETGGAVIGDRYHNLLFQNPGQGNHWLTVKLVGKKTNRAAIGARIKVVTAGDRPMTVRRSVSSGSSFGANPLQQTIGLSRSDRIAILEIQWPTSGTTQVFRDVAADQAIEVTEFAENYRPLDWKPLPQPH
jgi:FG-GAP-like repeat/ASPIC and UnbV